MRSQWNRVRLAALAPLVVGFALGLGCHARSTTTATATTSVFLVRHAEKATDSRDPSLTEEGRARAGALAHALADAGIEAIYSTQFARTRETAQVVSDAIGVEVTIFPLGDAGVAAFTQGLADEIRERQAGRRVLVVGHSNTVPDLMRALGAVEAEDLTEQDYDDLFLVEWGRGGVVRRWHLHYGAASP